MNEENSFLLIAGGPRRSGRVRFYATRTGSKSSFVELGLPAGNFNSLLFLWPVNKNAGFLYNDGSGVLDWSNGSFTGMGFIEPGTVTYQIPWWDNTAAKWKHTSAFYVKENLSAGVNSSIVKEKMEIKYEETTNQYLYHSRLNRSNLNDDCQAGFGMYMAGNLTGMLSVFTPAVEGTPESVDTLCLKVTGYDVFKSYRDSAAAYKTYLPLLATNGFVRTKSSNGELYIDSAVVTTDELCAVAATKTPGYLGTDGTNGILRAGTGIAMVTATNDSFVTLSLDVNNITPHDAIVDLSDKVPVYDISESKTSYCTVKELQATVHEDNVRVITGDYDISTDDDVLLVDTTLVPITITVTNEFMAIGKGFQVKDMKGTSATNNITVIQVSGAKFDGASSWVINNNSKAYTFKTDKSNYYIF